MKNVTVRKIIAVLILAAPLQAALPQQAGPVYHWRSTSGGAVMNHNPSDTAAMHTDSLPYAADYTIIAVYRAAGDSGATVWSMDYAGGGRRGLTTSHILIDSTALPYRRPSLDEPYISTLRQSAPDSAGPYVALTFGGPGVEAAELLYYNRRLGGGELRKVQSMLAIRYGVTLGPVDYVSHGGVRVWNYADSGAYHHRVAGIGTDSAAGLVQPCSRSEAGGALLTLSSDSLADGEFFVAGDNGAALAWASEGGEERLMRTWRMQSTCTGGVPLRLAFRTSGMALPCDSLVLCTDEEVLPPTFESMDSVVFDGVVFGKGVSGFTLGRGTALRRTAQRGGKGMEAESSGGGKRAVGSASGGVTGMTVRVYPNPCDGRYTVEVTGSERTEVTIYDMRGTVVAAHSSGSCRQCRFEGELPTGVYLVSACTDEGVSTMRLVVRNK